MLKQAELKDLKYGAYFYDQEGNEFIIRDKYDEGIWNTNKGSVIFEGSIKFYKTLDK